jgi:glycosyltransferase involved in cell wall biosynthesis
LSGRTQVSAVIPAYNERDRIAEVIKESGRFVDEVVVVDDYSTDGTGEIARNAGARVVVNQFNKGYIGAIKTGFQKARGGTLITLDADGEHDPGDIPMLMKPVLEGKADLVLGRREKISRTSERFLNWLTNFKVKVADSGTGFRAIKGELARKLNLEGNCTCGILVLEASSYGARITEVPVVLRSISRKRRIAWGHFWQVYYVLRWLLR